MKHPHTLPISPPSSVLRFDGGSGKLRARRYEVVVETGPSAGKRVLVEASLMVGSSPDAQLVLEDATVSRLHLQLVPQGYGVFLKDLGSKNGTLIGGARLETAVIEQESRVQVGRSVLRIRVAEDELPTRASSSFGALRTSSQKMMKLFGLLERVAPTDSPVVFLGETGTGKSVLAQQLHGASRRAGAPFVVFDCGAVSPHLVESALFGHVEGAFTGAVSSRAGLFEAANGGTLFLDEVGELPLDVQPKLLRVVEDGTFTRVGGSSPSQVEVRVVAATHRDLREEVRAKRFREDLFFRLGVVVLEVPPLRERREDVGPLIEELLRALNQSEFIVPPALLEQVASHPWPGNIRELKNVVERAVLGLEHDTGLVADPARGAPATSATDAELEALPFKEAKELLLESFTREYLLSLERRCGGNISQMARVAGIGRNHLKALAEKYGLRSRRES